MVTTFCCTHCLGVLGSIRHSPNPTSPTRETYETNRHRRSCLQTASTLRDQAHGSTNHPLTIFTCPSDSHGPPLLFCYPTPGAQDTAYYHRAWAGDHSACAVFSRHMNPAGGNPPRCGSPARSMTKRGEVRVKRHRRRHAQGLRKQDFGRGGSKRGLERRGTELC